jgi:hypothetical protein
MTLRQLRHGLCVCAIQRVNGQDKSAFERGMVVGARRTGLYQELQCCWVFHAQQFPVCLNDGPLPKGHPANLTHWSIGVNMGQHPCGMLLTPCIVHAQTN